MIARGRTGREAIRPSGQFNTKAQRRKGYRLVWGGRRRLLVSLCLGVENARSRAVMAAQLDLGDAQRRAPAPARRLEAPVGGGEVMRDQLGDLAELIGVERLQRARDAD